MSLCTRNKHVIKERKQHFLMQWQIDQVGYFGKSKHQRQGKYHPGTWRWRRECPVVCSDHPAGAETVIGQGSAGKSTGWSGFWDLLLCQTGHKIDRRKIQSIRLNTEISPLHSRYSDELNQLIFSEQLGSLSLFKQNGSALAFIIYFHLKPYFNDSLDLVRLIN